MIKIDKQNLIDIIEIKNIRFSDKNDVTNMSYILLKQKHQFEISEIWQFISTLCKKDI